VFCHITIVGTRVSNVSFPSMLEECVVRRKDSVMCCSHFLAFTVSLIQRYIDFDAGPKNKFGYLPKDLSIEAYIIL
jgi:hypothetical protein